MKYRNSAILFCFILGFLSCGSDRGYNQGFKKGEEKGYISGSLKGKEEGYALGLQDGYNQGYTDAMQKKDKSVPVAGGKSSKKAGLGLTIFTFLFFFLNIILLGWLIIYLIFVKEDDQQIRIAKIAYLLMSTAFGYLFISAVGVMPFSGANLTTFSKIVIVFAFGAVTFGTSLAIRKIIIKIHVVYSDVFAIFLSTFVLTYFCYLALTQWDFLFNYEFVSYCIMSMSIGGLAFAGHSLIDARYKTVR